MDDAQMSLAGERALANIERVSDDTRKKNDQSEDHKEELCE